jgi:ribosomal subunit interface protein
MKLIVQGKQMRVTAGLKRYAEKHLVQPLHRFYDNPAAELRVELGRANGNRGESQECHLTLHMPGARTIQIEESMPDIYGALEGAAHRLLRVARRVLDKRRWPKGRRKPHPLSAVVAEEDIPAGLVEELDSRPLSSAE